MSGQDYIPDEVFDKAHSFYDDKGSKVSSLRKSSVVPNSNGADADDTLLQSVYLAEGIHHHITEDALEDLPDRVQGGSVKAHLSWFGALCLAGIGMFVEAYLIITTGQIKSIWHAAYPTCWEPDKDMVCPENIQCCGLYPNVSLLFPARTFVLIIHVLSNLNHSFHHLMYRLPLMRMERVHLTRVRATFVETMVSTKKTCCKTPVSLFT